MTPPLESSSPGDPRPFFGWVFVLSLPFWAAGALVPRPLLPGVPVSALAVVCPALAAAGLAARREGAVGISRLLRRAWDASRVPSPIWWALASLLLPSAQALGLLLVRAARGPLPPVHLSALEVLALSLVLLLAAEAEELGWSAHAVEGLRPRHGPVRVGLIVGAFWAAWHLVPLLQAGRGAGWMAAWSVGTVAQRVLLVWLYERTERSVLAVSLAHASNNVAWQVSPGHGTRFDPAVHGLILVVLAVVVVATWRQRPR